MVLWPCGSDCAFVDLLIETVGAKHASHAMPAGTRATLIPHKKALSSTI